MIDPKMEEAKKKRDAWEKALLDAHAARKAAGDTKETGPIVNALLYPTRPKVLIRAFCWTCVGGEEDAGGRGRVRDCTVFRCAFWRMRPWQDVKEKSSYTDHPDHTAPSEDEPERELPR